MASHSQDGGAGLILQFVIGAALGAGPVAAAETPRAYMERLYASYRDSSFNPLTKPDLYFAPGLVAAIKDDARLANGEVGYLDGDPICQCQDPDGLQATVTAVRQDQSDKAEVQVSIGLTGYDLRTATFSLIRTRAGWRISDVSSQDEASLLHGIEESNRKQRENH